MMRKVLIVKPDGRFSTIYLEGPVEIDCVAGRVQGIQGIWKVPLDTALLHFIELQGRDE